MSFPAGQEILDPLPLVVSQPKALHGSALLEADQSFARRKSLQQ
jgi:hypothetical protein